MPGVSPEALNPKQYQGPSGVPSESLQMVSQVSGDTPGCLETPPPGPLEGVSRWQQ